MKFNEELFYIWLLDNPSVKRDATKRKIAHCMACLLELSIENKGKKVKADSLFKRANIKKAALHYAVGGVKNLWKMIRKATFDKAHCLSKEQKSIIATLFVDNVPTNQVSLPDTRLMNYPSALSLMIQRDYSIYRVNWAGGCVKLHCDKHQPDEHAEFLFTTPDGISISWNPSVQDQLAENWAVYRA
ncbi:Thoeris anti-defense Tad2 family protein (plasmid) [Xenorhabdus stockiae]|uniref:Thoeris anti-defense Tad2 family protein n=1 Tax=Xenorhabdus stockiae TaxID=351614 RepID=UPI003CF47EF6